MATVQEQLRTIRETLLGPGVLVPVIREFGLYSVSGEREADRAMEAMKSRIQIQVDAPDAFFVGFEGDQARQVTEVANRLATVFVERVSDIRGERVARMDSFLDTEVDRLRRQLNGQEEALKGYKESVVQELPDRVATNLKALEDLHQEAQSKTDKITEAQSRRMAVVEEMQARKARERWNPRRWRRPVTEPTWRPCGSGPAAQNDVHAGASRDQVDGKGDSGPGGYGPGNLPGSGASRRPLTCGTSRYRRNSSPSIRGWNVIVRNGPALTAQTSVYERRINASPGLETALSQRLRDIALTRSQYESMLAKQQAGKLSRRVETTGNVSLSGSWSRRRCPPVPTVRSAYHPLDGLRGKSGARICGRPPGGTDGHDIRHGRRVSDALPVCRSCR